MKLRRLILLISLILLGAQAALASEDLESKWLALILKDIAKELGSGCEYSFDDVSDKWIGLTGYRLETWHFTVCGENMLFHVSYYPRTDGSDDAERIEIKRASTDE